MQFYRKTRRGFGGMLTKSLIKIFIFIIHKMKKQAFYLSVISMYYNSKNNLSTKKDKFYEYCNNYSGLQRI